MTQLKSSRKFVIRLFVLLASSQLWAAEEAVKEPLVVFLVRHAEKLDVSRDPELSDAGVKRAVVLANVLRSTHLSHVHSTDFIRTRDTAAPIAALLKLKVELYDQNELPALVQKLRQAGGRHLVVGHSTSTPELVALLGGEAGAAINEAGEFDRLYVVTVDADGHARTVLLHYGNPLANAESQ